MSLHDMSKAKEHSTLNKELVFYPFPFQEFLVNLHPIVINKYSQQSCVCDLNSVDK